MDSIAIKEISDLAVAAERANRLDTHTPAILVGEKLIGIEHLQEYRSRFRGKFATSILSEYAGYLKEHTGGVGFIDPKACSAKVYLNLGTITDPGHGDWTASLALEATAAYAALKKIEGTPQLQKSLVEWIEDWSANLKGWSDGQPMPLTAALAAIRSVTIAQKKDVTHVDRDFGASRSSLEEIEAKSESGLPSHLIFTAEPYPGFKSRDFKLRLSVITGDKPALVLRTVSREQIEEDIAQEFKASLLENIGDAATMTIGSFAP